MTFPAVPYCRRSVRRTRGDVGAMPDCHLSEDSDNVSITNSEVESAMGHRRQRAAMRDPHFTEEAFNALSSADAYIRAARDGVVGATHHLSKDMQVRIFLRGFNNHMPVTPES